MKILTSNEVTTIKHFITSYPFTGSWASATHTEPIKTKEDKNCFPKAVHFLSCSRDILHCDETYLRNGAWKLQRRCYLLTYCINLLFHYSLVQAQLREFHKQVEVMKREIIEKTQIVERLEIVKKTLEGEKEQMKKDIHLIKQVRIYVFVCQHKPSEKLQEKFIKFRRNIMCWTLFHAGALYLGQWG